MYFTPNSESLQDKKVARCEVQVKMRKIEDVGCKCKGNAKYKMKDSPPP